MTLGLTLSSPRGVRQLAVELWGAEGMLGGELVPMVQPSKGRDYFKGLFVRWDFNGCNLKLQNGLLFTS